MQRHSASMLVSTVPEDHIYEHPAKLIKTVNDMKVWQKSDAYYEYCGFILAINEAVKGKSNSRGSENCSEEVDRVVEMLDKLDKKIDETPPIQQPQRFGNLAFRTWYQKTRDESLPMLQGFLPEKFFKAIPELVPYFIDGFGNSTRIDYGTGHEISFVMFLCCLFKIGFLKDQDRAATGCKIFVKYLDVVRKLQQTYRMEPAGSHGVWSLDDFQFVPFIWGSSQLFAHPTIEPSAFLSFNVLNQYGDDFMFLSCIRYINAVKTGPFAEHSNQLWSISGVPSWSKINGGLIKMYKAEVLNKFPVVQHIVFGSLFTLKAVEQSGGLMSAKTSMVPPPIAVDKNRGSGSVTSFKRPESEGDNRSGSSSALCSHEQDRLSKISGSQFSQDKSVVSGSMFSQDKASALSGSLYSPDKASKLSGSLFSKDKGSDLGGSLLSAHSPPKAQSETGDSIKTSIKSGQTVEESKTSKTSNLKKEDVGTHQSKLSMQGGESASVGGVAAAEEKEPEKKASEHEQIDTPSEEVTPTPVP